MAWWKGRKKETEAKDPPLHGGDTDAGEAQKPKAKTDVGDYAEKPKTRSRKRQPQSEEHLRKNGQSRLFKQLVASLKEKDPLVRSHAAWSLGRMGDQRAVDALTALLGDKDVDVRKDVSEALKRLGWKGKASS